MSAKKDIIIYAVIIILALIASQHLNVVVSGSMEPVFYRGDIVVVENANFLGISEFDKTNLKVGDIVIYNAKWFPEPVIHRIIGVNKDANGNKYYTIKGDNNPVADPENVYPQQITGKVFTINNVAIYIPKLGYVTLIVRGI